MSQSECADEVNNKIIEELNKLTNISKACKSFDFSEFWRGTGNLEFPHDCVLKWNLQCCPKSMLKLILGAHLLLRGSITQQKWSKTAINKLHECNLEVKMLANNEFKGHRVNATGTAAVVKEGNYCALKREQFPLILAFAMTIDKS